MVAKRLYWGVCGGVFAAGVIALAASPWLELSINLTHSLPGRLYLIHKDQALKRGDLIAYRWRGGATYPRGAVFIKRVSGVPGDAVKRAGSAFFVAGHYIGVAKPVSAAGLPLQPAQEGSVAVGEYFVSTPHPDSLDSRYSLAGNVKQQEVIGRAYEIF